MTTPLIILTIILFVLQSLSLKLVKADTLAEKLLSNCFFTLFAAVLAGVSCLLFPAQRGFSPITLLCGGLFGLCFSMTILFYLSAISCGPLSYASFYLSASMLLPAGAGILFFRERPSLSLGAALLFFLGAFYCLSASGGEEKSGRKWLLFCLLTFLCNGSCGIVQKTQQHLAGGREALSMMFIGFGSATLCYALCLLILSRRCGGQDALPKPLSILRRNLLPVCLLALTSMGGNLLLTLLSGQTKGSYLFPLVQGSIVLGVALCCAIFFREKLTLRGKLGILAGTVGIIVLNL